MDTDLDRVDASVAELDNDVRNVEQCVDSLVQAVNGSSSYFFC
jgi:hypothetical protein